LNVYAKAEGLEASVPFLITVEILGKEQHDLVSLQIKINKHQERKSSNFFSP